MVVLSSCSNRCVRDITMVDVSVIDGSRMTQNMPPSCEFCVLIGPRDVIFLTEGSMILPMHSFIHLKTIYNNIYKNIYRNFLNKLKGFGNLY